MVRYNPGMSDQTEVRSVRRAWQVRQVVDGMCCGDVAAFKGPLGDSWTVEYGEGDVYAWPSLVERPADPLHWPLEDGEGISHLVQFLAGKMGLDRELEAKWVLAAIASLGKVRKAYVSAEAMSALVNADEIQFVDGDECVLAEAPTYLHGVGVKRLVAVEELEGLAGAEVAFREPA